MKNAAILAGVILVGVGVWFYSKQNNFQSLPPGAKVVAQRPSISPESFSREDAISSLAALEAVSLLDFSSTLHRKAVEASALPAMVNPFVTPARGELVKYEQDSKGAPVYYASYFSEQPMPENYLSQLRIAKQNGFMVLRGVRERLSSTIDLESDTYQMRISQLAISEERTEVFISIKRK